MPGLADFAVDTKDNSKARFNVKEAKANADFMIEKEPLLFNKSHKESCDHFSNKFPRTVEDVVETDETRSPNATCPNADIGLLIALHFTIIRHASLS
eukprot:6204210-Pleurochrysis_carterae.AAC.1